VGWVISVPHIPKGRIMESYTIRNIPPDVHRAWKSTSALMGMTMRQYVIQSLKAQIEKDIKTERKLQDGRYKDPIKRRT
jgi:hypothetical protein